MLKKCLTSRDQRERFTKILLLFSVCLHLDAAEITVNVSPDRHIIVREHFSPAKPEELVFLVSPCARVENLRIDGLPIPVPNAPGPWITIPAGRDLSYDVVPISANPLSCAVPLLMPKMILDSVNLTVEDPGTGLTVSLPHMTASTDRKHWTATLPAVPSKVQLNWSNGAAPEISNAPQETGRFYWNFWGLVTVLITWTVAYLLWARRQA